MMFDLCIVLIGPSSQSTFLPVLLSPDLCAVHTQGSVWLPNRSLSILLSSITVNIIFFISFTERKIFVAATYTESDHFYTPNNMNYYQPNKYHYHSTPWRYRWGREANEDTEEAGANMTSRSRRDAEPRLGKVASIRDLEANTVSRLAENVSVAYQSDVWTNDMIYKVSSWYSQWGHHMMCVQDQDDCSKMMLCQLNAKRSSGETLSQNEKIIADAYGKDEEVDINAESLEFDIAALLGKVVSDRETCDSLCWLRRV